VEKVFDEESPNSTKVMILSKNNPAHMFALCKLQKGPFSSGLSLFILKKHLDNSAWLGRLGDLHFTVGQEPLYRAQPMQ
jgi:hypothetical protein